MSVRAGELVDQARDYHPGLDPRSVPDKGALRFLSRYQRRLAEKVFQLSEDALAVPLQFTRSEVEAALVGGISGQGLDLGDTLFVLGAYTRYGGLGQADTSIPVELVAYSTSAVETVIRWPAVYKLGNRIYPARRPRMSPYQYGDVMIASNDWGELDGITLLVVPNPAELVTLDSMTTLPNQANDAMVENLALWMAQRKGVLKELPRLSETAADAEQAAISAIVSQDASLTWVVR